MFPNFVKKKKRREKFPILVVGSCYRNAERKTCSVMVMIFQHINFSSPILDFDFSPNGKYVITVAEDRSIMLWSAKEFEQKEHK